MVDGVEFIEFNQAKQMREFKCKNAVGLQHDFEAFDKVVKVGNLSEDVVADNQVGGATFDGEHLRHSDSEEADKVGTPFSIGRL